MLELITSLFDGYGAIPMIIFAIGLIFCIVEIFVPGFGVFGIVGSVFIVSGVIARYLLDNDIQHLIVMVMFVLTVIGVSTIVMVYSAKQGMLGNSPLIENRTAISTDYAKDSKELINLLGKIAFTSTIFRPAGKFTLDGDIYHAMSYGEYIEKGEKIQVVEIKDNTIFIKRA